MKIAVLIAIFHLFLLVPIQAQTGEELFKTACASCHTINKGRLVGPDLTRVYEQKSEDWLISFIRSSQSMIKAGDKDAVAIFNEYNKIPMPDNNFTDAQISSIIDFIKETDQSSGAIIAKTDADTVAADSLSAGAVSPQGIPGDTITVTSENFDKGKSYYSGMMPFVNGSAPCISCHNISDGSFFGGGKLAFDLSTSYTKLGPAGVDAILRNPPFPAMRLSMPGELTDEEVQALLVLLKDTSLRSPHTLPTPQGLSFFVIAFVISIFIGVSALLLYDDRKIPDRNPLI